MRSVATNDCGHASPGLPSDSAGVKGWRGWGGRRFAGTVVGKFKCGKLVGPSK